MKVSVHPRGAQLRSSQKVNRQPAAKGRDPGDLEGEGIGPIWQKIPRMFQNEVLKNIYKPTLNTYQPKRQRYAAQRAREINYLSPVG